MRNIYKYVYKFIFRNQKEMNWLCLDELYCFSHNNYQGIVDL